MLFNFSQIRLNVEYNADLIKQIKNYLLDFFQGDYIDDMARKINSVLKNVLDNIVGYKN